jgi:hypothetical protein
MLKLAPVVLGLVAAGLAVGCTVSVKTQTKYVSSTPTALTSMATWVSQPIEVQNANGSVTVVSAPGATNVSVSAVPFAFADNQTDGDAAVADVTSTIKLDEIAPDATQPGHLYVHCDHAASGHGTAQNGTTGCDLTITIPAGSATQGVPLSVTAHNGPVSVSTVTAVTGQQIIIQSDNGSVTATGITGGVKAHSNNGPVTASFIPTAGANMEASTEVGDVALSLPASFATDRLTLTATQGTVTVQGFGADVTDKTTSRGAPGTGAGQIVATTGLGNVTLSASQ